MRNLVAALPQAASSIIVALTVLFILIFYQQRAVCVKIYAQINNLELTKIVATNSGLNTIEQSSKLRIAFMEKENTQIIKVLFLRRFDRFGEI